MRDFLKRHQITLLITLLILVVVFIYSVNLRSKTKITLFERVVLALTEPLQRGIDQAGTEISAFWNNYIWLVDTRQQNVAVMQANRDLRAGLVAVNEVKLENKRLKKLLDFVEADPRIVLPALVVAEDASSWSRTIVIDKGTDQGVHAGAPIVVAEGVVGRVIKAADNSSRVLLVTDASSSIAALVQRTRTRGVARGNGLNLTLEYALRDDQVEKDDLIVTSGMGGVFPKGLIIGRVTAVQYNDYDLFQQINFTPVVDFTRLEEVLVLMDTTP
ncbi:rod shape-determining protein MreC [Geopsychrobacter electrodiphilus]|uniref:rod shape-determining protein MreC n=1 Tax=Geopsychrobacter electrodiphilus TaxID=225196 RepID=UPI0003776671|nr:rod shape-determining protein MreC [Geopsychrobacter electrodiphilus]